MTPHAQPSERRPRLAILPSPPFYTHYRLDFFRRINAACDATYLCGQPHPAMRLDNVFEPGVRHVLLPWSRTWRGEPRLAVGQGLGAAVSAAPELLVVYGNINEPLAHALLGWGKLRRVPVLAWTQFHRAGSSALRDRIKFHWTRLFDGVLLYTDQEADEYRALGYPAHRICALNNGLEPIPPPPVRDPATVAASGDFIFCARLEAKNRVDLLLDAFADYMAAGGRRDLIIVGGGPDLDRLRAQAAPLGPRVRLTGPVFGVELAAMLAKAAFLVHPYGIGLSINTAFANGLPLLACADPAVHMPEFWLHREGITGFGFAAGGVERRALSGLLLRTDRIEAAEWAALSAACLRAVSNSNTRVMAERFLAFARMLCRRRNR